MLCFSINTPEKFKSKGKHVMLSNFGDIILLPISQTITQYNVNIKVSLEYVFKLPLQSI